MSIHRCYWCSEIHGDHPLAMFGPPHGYADWFCLGCRTEHSGLSQCFPPLVLPEWVEAREPLPPP